MSAASNNKGLLRRVLETAIDTDAAREVRSTLSDYTVLSPQLDPYRLDLPEGHRNGAWFAQVVDRLVDEGDSVHLRGLHYRLVAAADVIRPDNGLPYINTEEAWNWLCNRAAKAGRWLDYVDFDRIVDERNAAPLLFLPEEQIGAWSGITHGSRVEVPSVETMMPSLYCSGFHAQQPYRLCLIGEKTSLREVLAPIAEMVEGELCLPTGEMSDTMVAGIAGRAALDRRPTICLYFSDFDPAGRQMPISVARKLQALHHLNILHSIFRCMRWRSPLIKSGS
jgi:hypothetical protein